MASTESLIFDILAKDNASSAFIKAGKSAKDAAGNVQSLNDRLTEIAKKSVDARVGLKGDTQANASLDKIQAKLITLGEKTANPNIDVKGALTAQAQIDKVSLELDKLGSKGDDATESLGLLSGAAAGGGPTGMAALGGAAVALAGVLTPVVFGLGGLGLAAAGLVKPIENAAQKTGGLQKNLGSLNQEQQQVAQGILSLGKTFGQFEQAVSPEVFGIFSKGLQLAGHVLTDIEPVTKAVGKAFAGFLGQLDQTFQGGEFRQFFTWMAQNAAPDMRQLGQVLIDITKDIPALVEDLGPLGTALLHITDNAAHLLGNLLKLPQALNNASKATSVTPQGGGFLDFLIKAGETGSQALNNFTGYLAKSQQGAYSLAGSLKQLAGPGGSITQVNAAVARFGDATRGAYTPVNNIAGASRELSNNVAAAIKPIAGVAGASRDLANNVTGALKPIAGIAGASRDMSNNVASAIKPIAGISGASRELSNNAVAAAANSKKAGDAAREAAPKLHDMGTGAKYDAQEMQQLNQAVNTYITNTSSMLGATNSIITDIRQLTKDAGKTGASFTGLNNNSITLQNDLSQNLIPAVQGVLKRMTDAKASSHDLATVLATDLKPAVDKGALANKDLRDEIFAMAKEAGYSGPNKIGPLTKFIDNNAKSLGTARDAANKYTRALQDIPGAISTKIHLTTQAQIAVSTGVQRQIPHGAARGAYISAGSGPTADDVLLRASKGELVVPANMVRSGAVDHLRGSIPGFASGGLVGSFSGSLPGLTKWVRSEDAAVARVIAQAVEAGVRSAVKSVTAAPSGGGYNASYAAEYAFAKSLFPSHGWGLGQWPYLLALWNQESGWNPRAQNASSGAAGIPQDITGNFHGGYRGQIIWGENYIGGRYGTPAGAWAHEKAFNWYGSGFHGWVNGPTVFGAGERGRERVDITPGGQQKVVMEVRAGTDTETSRFIVSLIQKYVIVHGGDVQTALGQPA